MILPAWPPGTVCLLATTLGEPFVVPVSTAVRASDTRVLLALSPRRGSLARLRQAGRCSLAVLTEALAFTAHGRAHVVADPLPGAPNVVAVALDVDALHDHADPRFAIDAGVAWRWTDPDAEAQDAAVRAALTALA